MKASEDKLAKLHSMVAEVLTDQLSVKRELDPELEGTGADGSAEVYSASPALLAAAMKFLKDNDITCDIKTNDNMTKLQDTLSKKQKKFRQTDSKKAALKVVGDE